MELKNPFEHFLTCEYCSRIFESPLLLPCGETICKRDLRDLYKEEANNTIICFFCTEDHHIPDAGFAENKLINKLLNDYEDRLHISEIYGKAKRLCNSLETKLNTLENMKNKPSEYLDEFFTQVMHEIETSRNECKAIVDSIYERFNKDLSLFRFECQSQCHTTVKPESAEEERIVREIRDKLEGWSFRLSKIAIEKAEIEPIENEAQSLMEQIEAKINELNEVLFLNVSCKFAKKNLTLNSNIFGKLMIEYPSVENARKEMKR